MKPEKQFAALRIVFGIVWAIDAFFKWQPAFQTGFLDYFTEALANQPAWVQSWIQLWIGIVSPHPEAWAIVVAIAETAIALGLIFGLFTRIAIIGGAMLIFLIWAVPEGFGGPYTEGATDIGTSIIYVFVFVALWIGESWRAWSMDSWFSDKAET